MQRVALTDDGLSFSRCIQGYWRLGDWQMSADELVQFIEQGLELGITTTDHADIYGNYQCEALFGQALKLAPQLRDKIEVVSKCGIKLISEHCPDNAVQHYDSSAEHIIASAENSLRQLNTDYLDVLLIHRPDPLMQADEMARAFEQLKQQGKVNYFGVSNFTNEQFALLQSRLDIPLVTNQLEISVKHYDFMFDGTLDYLQQQRVKPMAWSCLGGGDVFTDAAFANLRKVAGNIAEELDAQLDQVLIAFVLALPVQAMPILGSGNIERVRQQSAAVTLPLTRQQWFTLLEAARGHKVA